MRARLLLAIPCIGIAVASVPSVAVAQQAGQDSVTGEFTVFQPGSPPLEFAVDAHSGPSGENPVGTFVASPNSTTPTRYSVACLQVTGNSAVVGVDQVNGDFNAFLRAVDAPVDTVAISPSAGLLSAESCARPQQFEAPVSVTSGDIVVVDAPPLPTTKDQCQHSGWRNYGVFKNQGDCVSFVATGGKNPPGKKAG